MIAYSRIYLGVHYPGDVIVGAIAGGILGFFTARFLKNLLRKPAISQ
jgi:undecaprenyl-diphosphatase